MTTTTSPARTYEWGNYTLEIRSAVGVAAHKNRGRNTGRSLHLLSCTYIVAVKDEAAEMALNYKTVGQRFVRTQEPVLFSVHPSCGCTNGQNAGAISPNRTEADVTCLNCLKGLARRNELSAVEAR